MNNSTRTFFAVRVTRFFKNGLPAKVFWVRQEGMSRGRRARSLGTQDHAERFDTLAKAKAALKYVCVTDALAETSVTDTKTQNEIIKQHGAYYYNIHYPYGGPFLGVYHVADVVKLAERITYEELGIFASAPERPALEQIAAQGQAEQKQAVGEN